MLKKFSLLFTLFTTLLFANGIEKRILLLHSYHSDMTWVESIEDAVEDILQPEKNEYLLYREYMDTKRHNSPEYYAGLVDIYKNKYRDKKLDIILSSDNNALSFLVEHRDAIFGEIPVIFCGVNGFDSEMLQEKKGFTGVAEQFSVKESVDEILRFHPDLEQIYIINDYLPTGRAWEMDIKRALDGYEERVALLYNENLTLEELKKRIDSFGEKSAILMGVYFADRDQRYITYEKIGDYLLADSKAPVYALLNFNVNHNVIGGKVIGGYTQGRAMSLTAKRVLQGENPDAIPITFSDANEFVFNYQGMERYGIKESMLPQGSRVINKPYSLYEEYKTLLITLIVIFASIASMLFLFIIFIKRREKNEILYKEQLIITLLRYFPVAILPIITLIIVLMFISFSEKSNQSLEMLERVHFIEHAKDISKREVERFIELVQYRLEANKNAQKPVAFEDIKNELIGIASAIRYGKSGYIIVGSMEGIMLSHPNRSLIGVNFFDGRHEEAKDVFLQFQQAINREGKGFVTYMWANPNTGKLEKKLTYVSYIPETNWYVASGVYAEDIEHFVQNKVSIAQKFEEDRILYLLVISSILVILSVAVSLLLSRILKKVFENYKKNIENELERNKRQELLLAQQSKMAELGMMMGAVLHQWKQPLSILRIVEYEMEDFLESEGEGESLREILKILNAQILFMNETIENFRKFSAPTGSVSEFFMYDVVKKIREMFKSQFEKRDIDIVLEEGVDFKLNGIEGEMMQVVLNLLVNAKEALEERGVEKKRITISSSIEKNRGIVSFRDNAGGVSRELLPQKIFEPHFTTKEMGSGIGLYICKKIIEEKYQGSISVENREEGAEFILELPLAGRR